jgi:FMN phosphatase YigB (HAD superfamily)
MSIKIAAFDLGNVIFKFDLPKFIKAYLKETCNYKVNDFNELIFTCSDILYSYERGNISSFDFYNALVKKTGYYGDYDEFSSVWNNIFEPIPETREVITSLV